jgi:hypothetical protein
MTLCKLWLYTAGSVVGGAITILFSRFWNRRCTLLHWLQRVVRYFLLIEIEREGGYTQVPLVQTNALYYRTLYYDYYYLKHSNLHLRVTHSPSASPFS